MLILYKQHSKSKNEWMKDHVTLSKNVLYLYYFVLWRRKTASEVKDRRRCFITPPLYSTHLSPPLCVLFSLKSCQREINQYGSFIFASVFALCFLCLSSHLFLGGQVSVRNASPWRPAKRHLGSFPGWNEEGALIRKQRRSSGEDAADTCPLHSWWNRLLTLLVFKLFRLLCRSKYSEETKIHTCIHIYGTIQVIYFCLSPALLQRKGSF